MGSFWIFMALLALLGWWVKTDPRAPRPTQVLAGASSMLSAALAAYSFAAMLSLVPA